MIDLVAERKKINQRKRINSGLKWFVSAVAGFMMFAFWHSIFRHRWHEGFYDASAMLLNVVTLWMIRATRSSIDWQESLLRDLEAARAEYDSLAKGPVTANPPVN